MVMGKESSISRYDDLFSLKNKVTIITGAGSGLGREVALGFGSAGANLILADRDEVKINVLKDELQAAGIIAHPVVVDVSDALQVKSLIADAIGRFEKIDVLVNCAGISKRMPSEDFDEDDWDTIMNVNLKGTFLCCKYTGKEMLKKNSGSIINFGSLGSVVAIPNSLAYCASKGGVLQLTKTLAVEWASRGVRVNVVGPGTFKTPLLESCIRDDPEYGKMMLGRFPIGRFAEPNEIVGICLFLASGASSYATGGMFFVDGGCTAY
jgi:NAD(P)-dependent dehydrogenase (short-subunit alcohol dehydrogenase family)